MGRYDDFEYGAHRGRDRSPRANVGNVGGNPARPTRDIVREILEGADPNVGMRTKDIADALIDRRDGDNIPRTRKLTQQAKWQVQRGLKELGDEVQNKRGVRLPGEGARRASFWRLTPDDAAPPPEGAPKRPEYYTLNSPDQAELNRETGRRRHGTNKDVPYQAPTATGRTFEEQQAHAQRLRDEQGLSHDDRLARYRDRQAGQPQRPTRRGKWNQPTDPLGDLLRREPDTPKRQTRGPQDPLGDLLRREPDKSKNQPKGNQDPLGDLLGTNKPSPPKGDDDGGGGKPNWKDLI